MEDQASGARKGSRRAARPTREVGRRTLAHGAGAAVAVIAWGGLVYAGVRLGQSARGGEDAAWALMAAVGLAAVGSLFVALMLGLKVAQALGVAPRNSTTGGKGGRRSAGRRATPRR